MSVPKLRFKREDGTEYPEWGKKDLNSICIMIRNGFTYTADGDRSKKYKVSRIETISSGQINMEKVGSVDTINEQYKMQKGDILVSHINSIQYLGNSAIYLSNAPLYHGMNLLCIRCNAEYILSLYLIQYMRTSEYFKSIGERAKRAVNQCSIPVNDFRQICIPVPCLEEQQKIADFLSTVDEVITQSEAEVQNLEQQKKAAMQKIFSQEVRFKREDGTEYPEWEEKELKKVAKILMGQSPSGSSVNTDKIGIPLVQGKADILGYGIIPDRYTSTPTKVSKPNDIIMTVRAPVGFVSKLGFAACIGRGVCAIRANEDEDYIYYVLQNKESEWKYIEQGSTFTAVNSDDVSALIVPVPCLEEQQKIADFLSAYDEAISYAKQELEHWKQLKKGLLQQMFV